MPMRAKAVMTAKVRGVNDLMVLKVLTNLFKVTGSNFMATPTHTMKTSYCNLANSPT